MSVNDLVVEIEKLGVQLWTEAGELRFRAPRDVMTSPRREALISKKAEVIEHLQKRQQTHTLVLDPGRRLEPFPLTDVQAAYLLGRTHAFAYGGTACQVYTEMTYADLDPTRVESAWRRLIERHDMLRAVIHPDGYQRILPEVPQYRVPVSDLRSAPDEVAGHLSRVRAEMDHHAYRPDQWPLFDLRITLARGSAVLHLSVDFIVADYLSIRILLAELDALYADPAHALPALAPTFRDYLLAERQLRDGPAYERDRKYWTERLETFPAAPELPRADDAETLASGRFRRLSVSLGPEQWSELRRAAAANGVTSSTAVLAAYAETIAGFSRQPRFTLNLTLLNRRPFHPDVQHLVGDFTTVTLLAVDRGSTLSFAERAKSIADQLFADMDHSLYTGVEVMRQIARLRGRDVALMPVVFTSTLGIGTPQRRLSGQFAQGISQTPQLWIDCQVVEDDGCLRLYWDVREGVLPAGLVDAMFDTYVDLLQRLGSDAELWSQRSVRRLPEAQRARRRAVNATEAVLPEGALHDAVFAQAERSPGRTALISGDHVMTYRDLARRARGVADALQDGGVEPGDIVAIVMDKGWQQVVAVLGAFLAGAAYLPIDANQPPARRNRILEDAGVRHALAQGASGERSLELPPQVAVVEIERAVRPSRAPVGKPRSPRSPGDLAYVIYTSGSTGTPKGVMVSHRSALNTIEDINRRFGVCPNDCVLGLASLGFDLSVYDIFGLLGIGGCLVLPDPARRNDPSHWYALIRQHRVSVWNSVPAQMQMLEHFLASEPGAELPSLKLALLSGDWIPVKLPDAIRKLVPDLRLISLGGATEAAIWSIYHPIDDVDPRWRSIPYGKPLANQTFHVLDEALEPRPDHAVGELYIGGAGLALGYANDPKKTDERFIRHPQTGHRLYRTGDLGRYLPDGSIEFLGREDRQIKIRGHRIELSEVEAALSSHPHVGAVTAFVSGHDIETRRLVAFVEPAPVPAGSPSDGFAERLAREATAAAAQVRAGFRSQAFVEFVHQLDECALLAMLHSLRKLGVFATDGETLSAAEVMARASVAPKHHRLIAGWLTVLTEEQFLIKSDDGRYRCARHLPDDAWQSAWSRVHHPEFEAGFSHELVEYMRTSQEHLPELMQDTVGAVQLVFPEGRVELWEATYRNNLLSRYVNQTVAAALREIARQPRTGPLRILEVGAGVGGITVELLPMLAGHDVDYLFTDVSQFFLNDASQRFEQYPWVRYGLFDLNRDYRQQGFSANSFDVIVSAHVMHYARHAGQAVAALRELLAPGGWLLYVDMTREGYQIMTSMMFLGGGQSDFEDMRRGRNKTFVTQEQWLALIAEAGGKTALCLPGATDVFTPLGQQVFAARFKEDRRLVQADALAAHAAARLPEYMVPAHIEIIDAMPLTANGKLDLQKLESWLPRAGQSSATGGSDAGPTSDDAQTDLERRLAALVASVLRLERVGRTQSFFDLGGDSLLAARLVGRMRDEIPEARGLFWDSLIRQFLPDPTVAALAAHLARQGEAAPATAEETSTASALVTLAGEGATPTVLVHDSSGGLGAYGTLAEKLAAHGPVLGLRVPDFGAYLGLDERALFEQLAADYASLLVERHGSQLHLVGYHSGGVLAAAIARHCMERGAEARSLTVISSYPIPCLVEDELLQEYLFGRGMGAPLGSLGYPSDEAVGAVLTELMRHDRSRVAAGTLAGLAPDRWHDTALAFRKLAESTSRERLTALGRSRGVEAGDIRERFMLFRHGLAAASLHTPEPYVGDITLIRHSVESPLWPSLRADMTQMWQELCLGQLRLVDAPGDHFDLLAAPHVDRAVELLLEARAEGGRSDA